MKITLSQNQWKHIGITAGWFGKKDDENNSIGEKELAEIQKAYPQAKLFNGMVMIDIHPVTRLNIRKALGGQFFEDTYEIREEASDYTGRDEPIITTAKGLHGLVEQLHRRKMSPEQLQESKNRDMDYPRL